MASSHLLELPAELRNYIYEFAVVQQKPTGLSGTKGPRGAKVLRTIHPALSMTCKQLRTESLAVYYGTSTFEHAINIDGLRRQEQIRDLGAAFALIGQGWCARISTIRLNVTFNLEPAYCDMIHFIWPFLKLWEVVPKQSSFVVVSTSIDFNAEMVPKRWWVKSMLMNMIVLGFKLRDLDARPSSHAEVAKAILIHLSEDGSEDYATLAPHITERLHSLRW